MTDFLANLSFEETRQLEALLKKGAGRESAFPYFGDITGVFIADHIDRIRTSDSRKVAQDNRGVRRNK